MADNEMNALVDECGESNVQAAFWLQEHIKEQGLDGIGFMEAAWNQLRSTICLRFGGRRNCTYSLTVGV
jgi:hypothetical protein